VALDTPLCVDTLMLWPEIGHPVLERPQTGKTGGGRKLWTVSLSQWFLSRKGEVLKVEQSGAEPCFIAVGTTVRIRFAPPVSPFSPVPSIAAGAKPGIRREREPGRDQRIAMCWPRARLALATFHFFIGAEHQRPTGQGFLPREPTPTFPPDDFSGFSRSGLIDCPSIRSSSFRLQ